MVGAPIAQESQGSRELSLSLPRKSLLAWILVIASLAAPNASVAQQHFNGAKAYEYARQFAAIGPRWPTGPGHVKAEEYLRNQFKL